MLFGYARVSTDDRNLQVQTDALTTVGCERLFTEKMSSTVNELPEFTKMLDCLRPGDTVIVWKLDRLGRSFNQLIATVDHFDAQGIGFRSLTESIDTTTDTDKLIFHVFGALAAFERSISSEPTKADLAAPQLRGNTRGRPPGLTSAILRKGKIAAVLYQVKSISVDDIARELSISKRTLYKLLRHERVYPPSALPPTTTHP